MSIFSSPSNSDDPIFSSLSPIASIVSSITSSTMLIYGTDSGLFSPSYGRGARRWCLLNSMRPKSMSKASNSRSYARKPSFGSTSSRRCFTNSSASSKETRKRFIIYMITQVAERLRPIAQCTNTTLRFEEFLLKAST